MPTLSGLYTSASGRILAVDSEGILVLHPDRTAGKKPSKLRADGEFWLCEDDGQLGKFGHPTKVILRLNNHDYHVWVEPRAFSNGSKEYGLIPTTPQGEYSNRFLCVNDDIGQLEITDEWTDNAKFRCIE